jgi:anti-anti-sigma factor
MIHIDPETKTIVFAPQGDFGEERVDAYRQALERAWADGFREIQFDLSGTGRILSSGLGFLVEAWKQAAENETDFRVISPSAQCREVLRVAGLEDLLREKPDSRNPQTGALLSLNRALASELRLLDRLHDVLADILTLREPGQIVRRILRGLIEAVRCDRGAFLTFEPEGGGLTLAHGVGLSEAARDAVAGAALELESPEGQAVSSGQAVWIDPRTPSPLLGLLEIPSAILAPVQGAVGGILGLLIVETPPGQEAWLAASPPLVETFASVCGMAIEKNSLLTDLEERNARLEQALLDLAHANTALNDSSKLATLGALVAGLGHAINNRLVPIMGYSQMLSARYRDDPDLVRQLGIVATSTQDLKRLLDSLTHSSRGRPPVFTRTDLNEIVESALALAEPSLKAQGITVSRRLASDLPKQELDRELMTQAFLSILHRTQSVFDPGAELKELRIESAGDSEAIEIRIEDNGLGMTAEQLEKIQDPLAPLQRIGRNETFNLSIPSNIVKKHGGDMKVDSPEGRGTRIKIRLPLAFTPPKVRPQIE